MPQIPVNSSAKAATAAINAACDNWDSDLRSTTHAGPRLQKKYPSSTRAVRRNRPLVLVYSPRTTIAITINTATTEATMKPNPNDLAVTNRLEFNLNALIVLILLPSRQPTYAQDHAARAYYNQQRYNPKP